MHGAPYWPKGSTPARKQPPKPIYQWDPDWCARRRAVSSRRVCFSYPRVTSSPARRRTPLEDAGGDRSRMRDPDFHDLVQCAPGPLSGRTAHGRRQCLLVSASPASATPLP